MLNLCYEILKLINVLLINFPDKPSANLNLASYSYLYKKLFGLMGSIKFKMSANENKY